MITNFISSRHKYAILILILSILCSGCSNNTPAKIKPVNTDLAEVKTFLVKKSSELEINTQKLNQISNQYYDLAKQSKFNYKELLDKNESKIRQMISELQRTFLLANTTYELSEGIVAGVPSLSRFDIDIDAGIAKSEGTENVVSFDLKLPNGEVLSKPGNYFALVEASLWATNPKWTTDAKIPEANFLKGATDGFCSAASSLYDEAKKWNPTYEEAFTALVVMIPTMDEYFQTWKESRIVKKDIRSSQFIAVSRLSDIVDILSGLRVVYTHLSPLVRTKDVAQADQIETDLTNLQSYVEGVYKQEKSNYKFTPEDADIIGSEAQNRATSIAGHITQAAAKLNIKLK